VGREPEQVNSLYFRNSSGKISARAKVYLEQHPELYQQALERAKRMGYVDQQWVLITPGYRRA
jgi:hypothetical protein